jgi:hypothetical protein
MFLTFFDPAGDTMNLLDNHKLMLWAMNAGLTRDEVRGAVRQGLDAGRIPRQRASESDADRQARFDAVRDYLQDQYLAGYQEYTQGVQARRAQGIQGRANGPLAVAPTPLARPCALDR